MMSNNDKNSTDNKTKPLLENENENDEYFYSEDTKEESDYILKISQPADKYYLAYFIFYLLGMTTLMPWNFFITADNYWMYKFRDPGVKLAHPNVTLYLSNRTLLQTEFTTYLSVASNIPSIAFLTINALLTSRISLQTRIFGSLFSMLILFVVTTVFVNTNTDQWQQKFFLTTIIIVVLLNVASAVLSGSIFGLVGRFSSKYITAVVGGQALGGIFAALAQIISLSLGASSVHSAFVYFMIANITITISIILYIVLSKTVFFKFYVQDPSISESSFTHIELSETVSYKTVLKKIWPHCIAVFLAFMITLSVYPGITVLIVSEHKGNGNKWNDLYFVPLIAYFLFNCGDYSGRLLADFIQWPKNRLCLIILNLARIIFIPLILFCNVQPRHHLPVLINKDYYYILITTLFALSNGYLANLSVILATKSVDNYEKEVASSVIIVFLGLGLTLGSAMNLILIKII